jgi:hypothetical protein
VADLEAEAEEAGQIQSQPHQRTLGEEVLAEILAAVEAEEVQLMQALVHICRLLKDRVVMVELVLSY